MYLLDGCGSGIKVAVGQMGFRYKGSCWKGVVQV